MKNKAGLSPQDIIFKTMQVAIVPTQEQIAARFLINTLKIIDDEHIIRTGRFRNSIVPTKMPVPKDPSVTIASVDCPYAVYLEYGTYKMRARAVFRRASILTNASMNKLRKTSVKGKR